MHSLSISQASGRETFKLLSVLSTRRQHPPAYIFQYFFMCAVSIFPSLILLSLLPLFSPTLILSLLSYCPWANKVHRVFQALVCLCRVWIYRLSACSLTGLLFQEQGKQVWPRWPREVSESHNEMNRWGGVGGGKWGGCRAIRKVPGVSGESGQKRKNKTFPFVSWKYAETRWKAAQCSIYVIAELFVMTSKPSLSCHTPPSCHHRLRNRKSCVHHNQHLELERNSVRMRSGSEKWRLRAANR